MTTENVDIVFRGLGAKTVVRDLEQIGANSNKAATSVETLRVAAQRARFELIRAFSLVAISRVISSSISTLANFSDAMVTIKGITNATGKEFDILRSKAKDLGASTVFTASQAADAMLVLARTGADTVTILKAITPALLLARAGGLELAQATEIMVSTLGQFNLESSDAGKVADILAKGANQAKTTVSELASALSYVGPISKSAGLSLQEVVAILGVLAQNGITASRAGTGLKNVLSNMVNPTGQSGKALRKLGLTMTDLKMSGKGLVDTLDSLSGTDLQTAFQLFKKIGAGPFLILSKNLPLMTQFTEALNNSKGSAAKAAAIMDGSLLSSLKRVGSAYENLILTIDGTQFFTVIFDNIAEGLRFIANNLKTAGVFAATFVATMASGLILRVVSVIFGISSEVGILTVALRGATFAAKSLGRALIIGFVIEALIKAVDKVRELNGELRKTKKGLTGLDIAKNVGKAIISIPISILESIANIGAAVTTSIIGIIVGISRAIGVLVSNFINIIKTKIDGLIFDLKKNLNLSLSVFNEKTKGLLGNVKGFDISGGRPTTGVTLDKGLTESVANTTKQFTDIIGKQIDDLFKSNKEKNRVNGADASLGPGSGFLGFDEVKVLAKKRISDVSSPSAVLLQDFNRTLEQNTKLSALNTIEKQSQIQVNQLVNDAIKSNTPLTEELTQKILERTIATNNQIDANKRLLEVVNDQRQPIIDYEKNTLALARAQALGVISSEQFARKMKELEIQLLSNENSFSGQLKTSLLEYSLELNDLGKLAGDSLVNGFRKAEDALVNFATTGKLNFKSLIDGMIADLARLAIRSAIGGIFGSIFKFLTPSSGVGSILGSLAGAGKSVQSVIGAGNVGVSAIPGLQYGGSFNVGGVGGTDSQLVQFRASPNERVTVETPGQRGRNGSNGGTTIINNIDAKGAEIGVEEKIVNALTRAAPLIVQQARDDSMGDTLELLSRRTL